MDTEICRLCGGYGEELYFLEERRETQVLICSRCQGTGQQGFLPKNRGELALRALEAAVKACEGKDR